MFRKVRSRLPSATAGCRVTYTIAAQWAGGFTANVALTNLGDPVTSWTLRWSFTGYPNRTFNQSQKNGILNGPYGSFLS